MHGVVKNPSGMSIYIIRLIVLYSIMLFAASIVLGMGVLLLCYIPTSFIYYSPSIVPITAGNYPHPTLVATGGLLDQSASYLIAPHTLPAFYSALESPLIAGGIASHAYCTKDNMIIVMGDSKETCIHSMTNLYSVFPSNSNNISSWSDLSLDELNQLQVNIPATAPILPADSSDAIPRIASLTDLLHLLKGYPGKLLYLTIDTAILPSIQIIVKIIHETETQDQVVLVPEEDHDHSIDISRVDFTSMQDILWAQSIHSISKIASHSVLNEHNSQILTQGPASAPLSRGYSLSFDHIQPRWDILRRMWCQTAANIIT